MTYRPANPWEGIAPGAPKARLIDRAFDGTVTPQDGRFMALAILQLCDELHELRARLDALEARVARLEGDR